MIRVIDASVAVKWFVDGDWAQSEDHVDHALALLLACRDGQVDFLQPPHFVAEVAAVLARGKPQAATEDIQNLLDMDFQVVDALPIYENAIDLSRQLKHHLFDTLYHALALATPGVSLITADRRYYNKAHHLGQILWLPEQSFGNQERL